MKVSDYALEVFMSENTKSRPSKHVMLAYYSGIDDHWFIYRESAGVFRLLYFSGVRHRPEITPNISLEIYYPSQVEDRRRKGTMEVYNETLPDNVWHDLEKYYSSILTPLRERHRRSYRIYLERQNSWWRRIFKNNGN